MVSFPNARSVPDLLQQRIALTPDTEAFFTPEAGSWRAWTWKQFGQRVRNVACGLRALGLKPEERCAIVSSTRLEWAIADAGLLCAGGATTTIYPSNTADESVYILRDSGSRFVFAENADQVKKLVSKRAELGEVVKVISFDAAPESDWVLSLAALEQLGAKSDAEQPGAFEALIASITPQMLATLIYTSGTTGKPKGVELTHDCWLYESEAMDALQILRPDDVQFLWLPLSHVFGKVLQVGQFRVGCKTAIDGRVDKLVESMGQVKPTFVAAVPRIFEKVHNVVRSRAKAGGAAKHALFQWALGVGIAHSEQERAGKSPGLFLTLQRLLADKLVFSKIKALFGGRIRFFVSGSAPLSRQMSEFFHALGLLVCEGYGLTESSAASFVNRPDKFKFGTVGLPLPGTEVRIAKEDGEILLRSRGVMRGYRGLSGATAESLDAERWLHTGDIGEIDSDGFLKITDRKKDLIKTSVGKYVAPQDLEGRFKAICPYVSQIVVHGNNRNFVTALVALDAEAITAWAREASLGVEGYAEIVRHEKTRALIKPFIDQLNSGLANYERIGKFAILPADLTLENGELTPSMKVKRKVVESRYKEVLDGFYSGNVEGG
jgi:long-chain acyl-CoA synthetase